MKYYLSGTKITDEQVQMLVDKAMIYPYVNPRTKTKRYYFGIDGLRQIIDLKRVVLYTPHGMIKQCQYTDEDGNNVATSIRRGYRHQKIFIENGTVYSAWTTPGSAVAETICRCAVKYTDNYINRKETENETIN